MKKSKFQVLVKIFALFLLIRGFHLFIELFTPTNINSNNVTRKIKDKSSTSFDPIKYRYGSCQSLQEKILSIINIDKSNWSITVLNSKGKVIASVNGNIPRVPASNQKLITTAFALDQLGPQFKLSTKLNRTLNGTYEIYGQGDPDFGTKQLRELINAIYLDNQNYLLSRTPIKIILYEEPRSNWWPDGWLDSDRREYYGAAITRLAINSNATDISIVNPNYNIKSLIENQLISLGHIPSVQFKRERRHSKWFPPKTTLENISSAPMISLMSLSNSESHNFTAEVLLRNAAKTWDLKKATYRLSNWLKSNRIKSSSFFVADGSGLSRNNRITTNSLAKILYRMKGHKYFKYYYSSMALSGYRGTLTSNYTDPVLNGKFLGKTGTLKGVRSLSGVLLEEDQYIYISVIANGALYPDNQIRNILLEISNNTPCSL